MSESKRENLRLNEKFKEFIKGNAKEEYTSDLNELVGSSIGINTYSNHGKFFCSKLVPDIWIHMGILKRGIRPNNYNLIDFTRDNMPFKKGILLGKIKYITL